VERLDVAQPGRRQRPDDRPLQVRPPPLGRLQPARLADQVPEPLQPAAAGPARRGGHRPPPAPADAAAGVAGASRSGSSRDTSRPADVGDPGHRAAGRRDLERLHRAEQRPDVGDGVRHQPEAAPTGLHDADRGAQPRLGRGQPEAQAQVQHRHHAAAQVEQAEHVPGAVGHRGQRRHPHHLDDVTQRQRTRAPRRAAGSRWSGRRPVPGRSLRVLVAGLLPVSTGCRPRLTPTPTPGRRPCRMVNLDGHHSDRARDGRGVRRR
jgi:hypothetical protein